MSSVREIEVWWHGLPALPADRQEHSYYALRRVWGDHTMAGVRGFYRLGCEDHTTASLFHTWAIFPDVAWVAKLVRAAGGVAGKVSRARWAYECNEFLDAKLRPYHKRDFIIPDIMMMFEDEYGEGLLAFEVKRPGKAADPQDARKIASYIDLPSTRKIVRRYGCILVSERMAERSRIACNSEWHVITWELVRDLQIETARNMPIAAQNRDLVAKWIARHFARYGVGVYAAPSPVDTVYGSMDGYRALDALNLSQKISCFLKGSEGLEALWAGRIPDPPLDWLSGEPAAQWIRQHQPQSNADRMVCRWHFDWHLQKERVWR